VDGQDVEFWQRDHRIVTWPKKGKQRAEALH
jgi:hypothetical protein